MRVEVRVDLGRTCKLPQDVLHKTNSGAIEAKWKETHRFRKEKKKKRKYTGMGYAHNHLVMTASGKIVGPRGYDKHERKK